MNIGGQELILIFVILLIAMGPKRLPEVARFISKAMRLLRKALDEIKGDINRGVISGGSLGPKFPKKIIDTHAIDGI